MKHLIEEYGISIIMLILGTGILSVMNQMMQLLGGGL